MAATPPYLLLICLFLFSTTQSNSIPISSYRSILSLSHSLASRVANLRAARGDHEGASRARNFARNLEPGLNLGFYKFAWTVGWDYLKNYSWRTTASFGTITGLLSDLNELSSAFAELNRLQSNPERVAWVGRNYDKSARVFKSLFNRLLATCRQSGPLRDLVEALQREVMEGELLRDCFELGAGDIKGLMLILKDIALQYSTASASSRAEL